MPTVGSPIWNGQASFSRGRDTEVQGRLETAEAIARRYRLNAKSYRHRLRASVLWRRQPQDSTFPVGSAEWRNMFAVAEEMVR